MLAPVFCSSAPSFVVLDGAWYIFFPGDGGGVETGGGEAAGRGGGSTEWEGWLYRFSISFCLLFWYLLFLVFVFHGSLGLRGGNLNQGGVRSAKPFCVNMQVS